MTGFYESLIRHRLAANLLMMLVIGAGIWGMQQVRSQLFPDTELPIVRASFDWPNADVEAVRTGIAEPLDRAIMDTRQFDFVRSTAREGGHSLFARVRDGVSAEDGLASLEAAIDSLNLPGGATLDDLEKIELTEPVASVLIYGDVQRSELAEIGYQARQSLINAGMAEVALSGIPGRERRIEIDLAALDSLGMTLDTLASRLRSRFTVVPAGSVTVGENSKSLVTDAPDWTLDALRNTIIAERNGAVIRLSQVATLREDFDNADILRYQGMPAIQLEISRAAGEDTLVNAQRLDEWMADFESELPYGIEFRTYNEIWKVVEAQLNLVLTNGIGGMLLVILVLFVFLRTRLAVWVAAGIPISFMGTLAFMGWSDTTLNTISLFGFVIAIGIIVDDAIVVAEDTAALESQGLSPSQAALTAAKRMMPAVVASSLTTIAAFLPLLLIGGTFGNLLVDIPTVVTAAIIASLVECFIILPGHLGHHRRLKAPSPARQAFENGFNAFRDGPFQRLVRLSIANGAVFLAAMAMLTLLTLGAVTSGRIAFEPSPSLDEPTMSVSLDMLEGTSLSQVEEAMNQLQVVAESIDASVGGGLIDTMVQAFDRVDEPERATLELTLTSDTDRPLTNAQVLERIQQDYVLPPFVRSYSSGRFFRGPGGGGDLSIRLEGDDIQRLKEASLDLQASLQGYESLGDITDNLPFDAQQYRLQPTRAALAAGIDMNTVAGQVANQLSGLTLTTVETGYEQIPVTLNLTERQRQSESWLQSLPIRLDDGSTRPLGSLVHFEYEQALNRISSRNGELSVTVSARYNGDQLTDLYSELEADVMPTLAARHPIEWAFEGQAEELEAFFNDTLIAVAVSVLLIYFILAWVFESWLWPFAVLITVPFGLIGAVVGHWLMNMPLSTISVFGLIGLSGIVINDSIILVTVFRRLHRDGLGLYEATVEAALSRLRPVILTSITTMAGLSPLLFETSIDAALLKPIAVGLVFGLGFGTLLILLMVPVLLYKIGRFKAWFAGVLDKDLRGRDPETVDV
ncbi:efflux RND transporter permease subunit [Saccharospirillum salsuginis]|uniref:Acriflavin resistance protein n=1 Tax=Saccharospirillum salsuginis TaxID=418750 RepID=A0A918KKQ6_9GAMM|nr:efflux RND transporter permease subunit [Saccharospirillum salsuginis]GGX65269.1 acriflavin resistance protein [Saccharospirillum salsuginis]